MSISVEDNAAFEGRLAVGMALGSHKNGNLRISLTLADGSEVAAEVPHVWLQDLGGMRHFIEDNCHPTPDPEPEPESSNQTLQAFQEGQ